MRDRSPFGSLPPHCGHQESEGKGLHLFTYSHSFPMGRLNGAGLRCHTRALAGAEAGGDVLVAP